MFSKLLQTSGCDLERHAIESLAVTKMVTTCLSLETGFFSEMLRVAKRRKVAYENTYPGGFMRCCCKPLSIGFNLARNPKYAGGLECRSHQGLSGQRLCPV